MDKNIDYIRYEETRKSFLKLPIEERRRLLKEQASDPKIREYYRQLFEPKPNMLDECECGHTFEEHDWGAWQEGGAGCLVTDEDEKLCQCEQFKPKPSESRLLTEDEAYMLTILGSNDVEESERRARKYMKGEGLTPDTFPSVKEGFLHRIYGMKVAKAQRDLTNKECAEEKERFAASVYDSGLCMGKSECQKRVEGIKKGVFEYLKEKLSATKKQHTETLYDPLRSRLDAEVTELTYLLWNIEHDVKWEAIWKKGI